MLCDVGERVVISYLAYLPDRLTVARVCKRWHRLSQTEIPIQELNFSTISTRKVTKNHLKMLLQRAAGKLESVSLPGFSLDDACLNALKQHVELRHMRAYTPLSCSTANYLALPAGPSQLQSIHFNACHSLKASSVSTMITQCGQQLTQLVLTGAENVDSSIFHTLARHAPTLEELTISYSRAIRLEDLQVLMVSLWSTLRLLDLSCCAGFQRFPGTTILQAMQVLILDNTHVADDALRRIAVTTPQLKYLSLQDCRSISDQGLIDLATTHDDPVGVELLDLKGTRVTNVGVDALESGLLSLRMLRLDSCRNVSRELRLRQGEHTRAFLQRRAVNSFDRLAIARIARPEQIDAAPAADNTDSDAESDLDELYED